MARQTLTREAIVDQALQLMGEEGLESLSMRKLGERLKVKAPTLYYHVPDKSALLNDMLLVLFERCVSRMPECETWQQWMQEFGRAIWDVQQEAKYSPVLILSTHLDEEHFSRIILIIRQELERFEVDQEELMFVQSAVQAVITGWSVFANSVHAEKTSRLIEFREAAMRSVQALISGCAESITVGARSHPSDPSADC